MVSIADAERVRCMQHCSSVQLHLTSRISAVTITIISHLVRLDRQPPNWSRPRALSEVRLAASSWPGPAASCSASLKRRRSILAVV